MITKENLLSIPIFNFGFELKSYKSHLESFLNDINKGRELEVTTIIHDLISLTVGFCGYSKSYRTVSFDFAWAVLDAHPSLWTQVERDRNYCQLSDHWLEFYPECDGTFDNYDVASLEELQYFTFAINMLIDNEIEEEYMPVFSYAIYLFFKDKSLESTDEEMKMYFGKMQDDEN
ncbi:MAG: hypothetical protein ACOYOV_18115 [Bacteroidales bacterium]